MTNFTKSILKKIGIGFSMLIFCLTATSLTAQTPDYTLTVSSPASIAGNYPVLIGAFGYNTNSPSCQISGQLSAATDNTGSTLGCNAITQDLSGKIAVIDRGTCEFGVKVFNAQRRGAIAVIIVNNAPSPPYILMGSGTVVRADSLRIPAFFITQADGNKIKAQLANNVTVTISQIPPTLPSAAAEPIIWGGQAGQGDFTGGLNGWTTNTLSCNNGAAPDTAKIWRWSSDGTVRGACGVSYVFSPTRCSGAAVLESDFADSGGDSCGVTGVGACPSPHAAELVSPNINISASTSTADLVLRYYQATREFDATYLVAWTTDGGVTWDTTEVNTDLDETAPVPSIQRVNLEGTQGEDSLRVKFIFDGDYYYWAIDDVYIVELADNNLSVNPFFAVAPNYATPLSQVEPIAFLADVENVGAKPQTNVKLNASVFYRPNATTAFTQVFSADKSYGTVPAGALVENLPFSQTYRPNAIGQYVGGYEISSDSADAQADNNEQAFNFFVEQSRFSKDAAPTTALRPSDIGWEPNEDRSWAWGNYYFLPKGKGFYVQSVTFGLSTTAPVAGRELLLTLYKWNDANGNALADPAERVALNFASYIIRGTEAFNSLVTIPFPDPTETNTQLEDSTAYLMMAEYLAEDQAVFFMSASEAIDYGGMILVTDSLNRPRYASVLGVNDDLSSIPYSTGAFGTETVPSIRMTIGTTPSSTQDLSKLDNEFTVFPNPATESINMQLNLQKQAQTATVRLFDVSGKLVNQWSYDNVQKERYQYPVQNLAGGIYFLQVVTEQGAGTQKFSVQR
jgi:hypothetical protein